MQLLPIKNWFPHDSALALPAPGGCNRPLVASITELANGGLDGFAEPVGIEGSPASIYNLVSRLDRDTLAVTRVLEVTGNVPADFGNLKVGQGNDGETHRKRVGYL